MKLKAKAVKKSFRQFLIDVYKRQDRGNTYRIRKAIEKARAGKEVTLAYIGGSITQGAGATPINTECYAYKSRCV